MNTATDQRQGMVQRLYRGEAMDVPRARPAGHAGAGDEPDLGGPVLGRDAVTGAGSDAGGARAAHGPPRFVPGGGRQYEGGRYLVSMLGKDANWVLNVRAAQGARGAGAAAARRCTWKRSSPVTGHPSCGATWEVAPEARPHLPVDRHAPLAEFERIADQYPVFWIIPAALGAKRAMTGPRGPVRARWSSLTK